MTYAVVRVESGLSGVVETVYLIVDTTTTNGQLAVAQAENLTQAVAIRDALNA